MGTTVQADEKTPTHWATFITQVPFSKKEKNSENFEATADKGPFSTVLALTRITEEGTQYNFSSAHFGCILPTTLWTWGGPFWVWWVINKFSLICLDLECQNYTRDLQECLKNVISILSKVFRVKTALPNTALTHTFVSCCCIFHIDFPFLGMQ